MARSSRSSRPAPRAAAPPQSRGAHTTSAPATTTPSAAPPVPHAAPGQQGPGMMAQMAATAGSVAIGSTLGHGLSSMLFGGSSAAAAPAAEAPPVQQQSSFATGAACEAQAKDFTKCLDKADLPSCSWYLDQLKACQAAAAPY